MIRAAAIIPAPARHVGRPGGGVLALRGHACIQGATDIPVLFDMLPGYCRSRARCPVTLPWRSIWPMGRAISPVAATFRTGCGRKTLSGRLVRHARVRHQFAQSLVW